MRLRSFVCSKVQKVREIEECDRHQLSPHEAPRILVGRNKFEIVLHAQYFVRTYVRDFLRHTEFLSNHCSPPPSLISSINLNLYPTYILICIASRAKLQVNLAYYLKIPRRLVHELISLVIVGMKRVVLLLNRE